MARATRPSVAPKEVVLEKEGNVVRLKIPLGLTERLRGRRRAPASYQPFKLPDFPPAVKPAPGMAMDDEQNIGSVVSWGAQAIVNSAYAEGQVFLGYAQLSILAQRPEYRKISETIATETTREWITLKSTGEDDKAAKIARLNHLMGQFKLQHVCRKAVEGDGFFGRGHIYVVLRDAESGADMEEREELIHSIGNGRDKTSQQKVTKGSLAGFRNVEAVWCYPNNYNSNNPLASDWYKPRSWICMGTSLDRTRLLTIVSREVPDIIKPAYSFGGLSLTQMVKPYVDNWLRTRQSVSDLVHSFSVSGIKTNLQSLLTPGGDDLLQRIDFFNAVRDNSGAMLLDKDTEEWFNVTTPLSTLDALQAQAQEQMASVAGIPIVKLLGITPSGLNASTDGEIRVFYDAIHALQESVLRTPIGTMIDFIQLNEWGEVDPEISFEFDPLWQLDDAGNLGVEKTKTDIDDANVAMGSVSPEEVRKRLAGDPKSIYHGLDLSIPLPEPEVDPNGMEQEQPSENPFEKGSPDVPKPRDPSDRLAGVTSRSARQDIMSGDAFEEGSRPRDESGKFNEGHAPVEPGTAKIPEGSVRRFHATHKRNLDKISSEGLKPRGSPSKVYSFNNYQDASKYAGEGGAVLEFHHEPEFYKDDEGKTWNSGGKNWNDSDVVPPKNVVAVHHPWHVIYHQAKVAGTKPDRLRRAELPEFDRAAAELEKEHIGKDAVHFSKSEVRYEYPAKGEDHCGECENFRGPAACALVSGDIDAEGWCEEFERPGG